MNENQQKYFSSALLNLSDQKEYFQSLLDALPFGISIQNNKRIIEYENNAIKTLLGSHLHDQCYRRWGYLPEEGELPCKDCPASLTLIDKKSHKIFRKTLNGEQKSLFLEIEVLPILNEKNNVEKYIEIITNKSVETDQRTINENLEADDVNDIRYSLIKYGSTGSQILFSEQIDFFKDKANQVEELTRLSTFAFIGLFQNNTNRFGLFGPLPVLDYLNHSMIIFTFQVLDETLLDPRKKGIENCLLILFYPRNLEFILLHRKELAEFIAKEVHKVTVIDQITEEWFNLLTNSLTTFLKLL